MFGIVRKDGNNNKYIHPLTSDVGAGAPVGTIIAQYKKANPEGYLYLDGSTFDADQYPALYMYLGTNVLPDYREFALVGAEQNSTETIAAHDVYTEGQAKDDQVQSHKHDLSFNDSIALNYINTTAQQGSEKGGLMARQSATRNVGSTTIYDGRTGTVTRGKRKAVFFYIKATSGLAENQQENVLNTAKNYSVPRLQGTIGVTQITLPSSGQTVTLEEGWYSIRAGTTAGSYIAFTRAVSGMTIPFAFARNEGTAVFGALYYIPAGEYNVIYNGAAIIWKITTS